MPIKGPGGKMRSRLKWMAILCCTLGFLAVVVRLIWMQVYNYDYYNSWANKLQTRDTILTPKRGSILDANGTELAVSASTETVEVYPTNVYEKGNANEKVLGYSKEAQQERLAKMLSDNLNLDYDTVLSKVQDEAHGGLTIAKGIEKEVTDQIRAEVKAAREAYEMVKKTGVPNKDAFIYAGYGFIADYHRYYPLRSFASQIIGQMSDGKGSWGIEGQYEAELAGSAGRVVRAASSAGDELPVEAEQEVPAQDGNSVVMTIDSKIQETVEKQLETALADNPQAAGGVSCVIMEVKTGNVLALANLPEYDVNEPKTITSESLIAELRENVAEGLTEAGRDPLTVGLSDAWYEKGGTENLTEAQRADKDLTKLIGDIRAETLYKMWRIGPVSDTYEPGSTFKLFTVASAYEEHAVKETDNFNCGGRLQVDSKTSISCHKREGHGSQTLTQALMNSCNVAMMNIAFKLGADKFYEYFDAFGMLAKSGIDLPGEANSTMHTREALNKTKSTLATAAFGQRFKITPIQMLSTVCAIVDDGKLKTPHMVKEIRYPDGTVKQTIEPEIKRQVVSAETSAYMRSAMEQVVSAGTGQNAYVAGYRIGGKTATSELSTPGTPIDEQRFTASFVGVAPIDDPQIAVLVIISDLPYAAPHGGGAIAAPVVGRIMSEVLPYLGVEPVYTEDESDRRELAVPRVVELSKEDAQAAAENAGLTCRFLGEGDTVSDQVPSAGVKIPSGSEMIIYLGGRTKTTEKVTVPNLIGQGPDEVKYRLQNNNLYLKRTGVATNKYTWQTTAIKQNPAAGTEVNVGTVIEVEFSNTQGVNDR